jgi:ADP-heptose:LPS heptosyltransferase
VSRTRNKLIHRLASAQAWLIDRLVDLGATPAHITSDVLVVRLDAIGDFLLWSDAAGRLADHYHAAGRRVLLLANASWADLAETLGVFDAVLRLDRRRFLFDPRYRFATLRWVHQAGFALAVQPTFSRELLFGDAVMRVAGHEDRIGSVGDLANMSDSDRTQANRWYSRLLAATPAPMMEIERNVEFLAGLGIPARPRIGRLAIGPEARPDRIDCDDFVLFPGAGWTARCWPPESFAALAERIATATGWRGVMAGGPGDRAATAAVRGATSLPLTDKAGTTSLIELAGLLQNARLVISNETGAIHLAAAVGTPSVCIIGGGHFGRFLPYTMIDEDQPRAPRIVHQPMDCYGCNWACRYPRSPKNAFACIRAIDVDQVWEMVIPLLPGRKTPN